jgi:2-deoxystreptamine N-acetyl-D-glucosaminyltransferase/2-deoxystreptamine glucosyltransferase
MAALAHGMPIITTWPQGSVPQLRDGENVLLVPPQDPQALGAAILRLADDVALRRRLQAGARALAAEFDWRRIAARTLEVYHALAGR